MESLDSVRKIVSEKYKNEHRERWNHIVGVVEMAQYLAEVYQIDPLKAGIAAYMHDYCKYDDYSEIEKILTEEEMKECRMYPFLYHAYGSAYQYKAFGGKDEEIYQAIRNHVFGRPNMSKLEEIIMIADYTEKNRKIDECIQCRKILLDKGIEEAIVYSLRSTMDYVLKQGNMVHPRQQEVYNEYSKKVEEMRLEEEIIHALDKVKANDILVYDMKGRSPLYDELILCSVSSQRQAASAVTYIKENVEMAGFSVRNIEGVNSPWVLIDCGDVIVSIFTKEEREHFGLEKIYMDVPVKKV